MTSSVQLHSVFLQSVPRSIQCPGNCYASLNTFLRCNKLKLSANSSERQGGWHLQQLQNKTFFRDLSVSMPEQYTCSVLRSIALRALCNSINLATYSTGDEGIHMYLNVPQLGSTALFHACRMTILI